MLFLSSFPLENVNILTLLKSRPFHPKDSIRHFATIIRVSDLKAFEDITAGQTKKGTLRKWPKVRERLRENGLEDFHPDKYEDLKKKRKSESRDGGRGFWSRRHWQPKPAGRFSFMLRQTLTKTNGKICHCKYNYRAYTLRPILSKNLNPMNSAESSS